jgi:uncharacterized HAD superfamily protein
MSRPVIAFDFDDVLMSFQSGFIAFHNRMYGTALAYEDVTSYDARAYQCNFETFTERVHLFYQSPDHKEVTPIPGSIEALQSLQNHYLLDVVTSRPAVVRDCTHAWTDRFFPNVFRSLHFTNGFGATDDVPKRSKSEVCTDIGASILVDDALEHAVDVAQKGIPVLLPDRPWNQGSLPIGVTRIHSWDEMLSWITEHV